MNDWYFLEGIILIARETKSLDSYLGIIIHSLPVTGVCWFFITSMFGSNIWISLCLNKPCAPLFRTTGLIVAGNVMDVSC